MHPILEFLKYWFQEACLAAAAGLLWFQGQLHAHPYYSASVAIGFLTIVIMTVVVNAVLAYEVRQAGQERALCVLANNQLAFWSLLGPQYKRVAQWIALEDAGKVFGDEMIKQLQHTDQIVQIQVSKVAAEITDKILETIKKQVAAGVEEYRAEMKQEIEALVEQNISTELKKRLPKKEVKVKPKAKK